MAVPAILGVKGPYVNARLFQCKYRKNTILKGISYVNWKHVIQNNPNSILEIEENYIKWTLLYLEEGRYTVLIEKNTKHQDSWTNGFLSTFLDATIQRSAVCTCQMLTEKPRSLLAKKARFYGNALQPAWENIWISGMEGQRGGKLPFWPMRWKEEEGSRYRRIFLDGELWRKQIHAFSEIIEEQYAICWPKSEVRRCCKQGTRITIIDREEGQHDRLLCPSNAVERSWSWSRQK